MTGRRRWRRWAGVLLAASLTLTTGCQTWIAGMTLPSPSYLEDTPDYIPKKAQFPLPRELAAMQRGAPPIIGAAAGPAAPGVVPPGPGAAVP